MVNDARDFIFFGTYSINPDLGIVRRIIEMKMRRPNLYVICLLPPPTDYVLWDYALRREFERTYNVTGSRLFEAIAQNPIPAFTILDRIWNQAHGGRSRLPYQKVLNHIRTIGEFYSAQIITLLEPNMHAKFIVTESNIYEGSGNLTYYGLRVNVEVYNFYSSRGAYNYASSSYYNFLNDYISRFVEWKSGSNYLRYADQLSNTVSTIVSSLGIRFNPTVSNEKIRKLTEAREKLSITRSDLWMLPGHLGLSKVDLLLSAGESIISEVISQLYQYRSRELKDKNVEEIHGSLELASKLVLRIKKMLSEFKREDAYYEKEYLPEITELAVKFKSYLQEKGNIK